MVLGMGTQLPSFLQFPCKKMEATTWNPIQLAILDRSLAKGLCRWRSCPGSGEASTLSPATAGSDEGAPLLTH